MKADDGEKKEEEKGEGGEKEQNKRQQTAIHVAKEEIDNLEPHWSLQMDSSYRKGLKDRIDVLGPVRRRRICIFTCNKLQSNCIDLGLPSLAQRI